MNYVILQLCMGGGGCSLKYGDVLIVTDWKCCEFVNVRLDKIKGKQRGKGEVVGFIIEPSQLRKSSPTLKLLVYNKN